MDLTVQVIMGTALLAFCALLHVTAVVLSIPGFRRLSVVLQQWGARTRTATLLSFGVVVIVIAHTVQVWSWALAFYGVSAFPDFPTSFYFATVTYTTLGYGDLVLGEDLRIFGTFASITGLLTFGISTALLIGLITRLLPKAFVERD